MGVSEGNHEGCLALGLARSLHHTRMDFSATPHTKNAMVEVTRRNTDVSHVYMKCDILYLYKQHASNSRKNKSMSKQPSQANEQISSSRMSDTADYSAHIQEAMRYNKLRPSEYHIVMTIMHAVSQGLTEEKWENEQQSAVSVLTKQPPDEKTPHA